MRALDTARVVAGLHENEPAGSKKHRIMPVTEALSREWLADLYLCAYRTEKDGVPLSHTWRLKKEHVAKLAKGYKIWCDVRIGDLDTSPKRKLTQDDRDRIASVLQEYGAAYYLTLHGARVIQAYVRPLSPDEQEVCLQRWHVVLGLLVRTMGIPDFFVDTRCCEWNRFFRMPKVVRVIDGKDTNLWHTQVYNLDCPAIDPGDCTPPPKMPRIVGPSLESFGTTRLGRKVLTDECELIQSAADGMGTDTLAKCATRLGSLSGAGQIDRNEALDEMRSALSLRGYDSDDYA